ncbi:hypothetical protein F2Q70_00040337 [Brassica cretica]|uniref:Uncharacterized protein n=1 Tax=Brassica cretica TaxID=69181 RepID=A0A8S9KAZ2_BRACR|nr:hypothetical protein F2Q70_00040337 [Brassica cretica]
MAVNLALSITCSISSTPPVSSLYALDLLLPATFFVALRAYSVSLCLITPSLSTACSVAL